MLRSLSVTRDKMRSLGRLFSGLGTLLNPQIGDRFAASPDQRRVLLLGRCHFLWRSQGWGEEGTGDPRETCWQFWVPLVVPGEQMESHCGRRWCVSPLCWSLVELHGGKSFCLNRLHQFLAGLSQAPISLSGEAASGAFLPDSAWVQLRRAVEHHLQVRDLGGLHFVNVFHA